MNTETENTGLAGPKSSSMALVQTGISALALVSLLVAAILNPDAWVQFGIALPLVSLCLWFASRVQKVTKKPWEHLEAQVLIQEAEKEVSKKEKLVDQIAKFWPIFVFVVALFSVVRSVDSEFDASTSLQVFTAVLLLTYSQALSLTIPVSISIALRAASSAGILIRNRQAFEEAAKLDLVLFTKSGVLTEPPEVIDSVHLAANSTIGDENKLLALAASVESMSKHVLALAISRSATNAKLKLLKPKSFKEYVGYGVEGNVAGKQILIGSTSLLIQRNIRMEVQELVYADENTKNGYSIVCVVVDGVLEGLLRFSDVLKPSSALAVYMIAKERIRVGIATGDSAGTAQHKAGQIAVSEVYAELSPARKVEFVESAQAKGFTVGAIADSLTDSALLEQADLSIAMGEDLELDSTEADVLVRSDGPLLAAQVIALSARLRKRTNLGLGFGLGYGVLSLASIVAIVSPLQVVGSPAIAALLGSLSVLFVTLNAYSLGKLK